MYVCIYIYIYIFSYINFHTLKFQNCKFPISVKLQNCNYGFSIDSKVIIFGQLQIKFRTDKVQMNSYPYFDEIFISNCDLHVSCQLALFSSNKIEKWRRSIFKYRRDILFVSRRKLQLVAINRA